MEDILILNKFIYGADLFGTVVFAIAGVIAAAERRLDIFGVIVVGSVTAIGGGTLRDLILGNTPVFWIKNNLYIYLTIAASISTFILERKFIIPRRTLLVADAIGLAVFSVIGSGVAIHLGYTNIVAVITGIMSGVFGGIIRDMLVAQTPLIFHKEIYATASLAGSSFYVVANNYFPENQVIITIIAMSIVLALRLSAIYYKLQLPVFMNLDIKNSQR